jgi:hypothetical protein
MSSAIPAEMTTNHNNDHNNDHNNGDDAAPKASHGPNGQAGGGQGQPGTGGGGKGPGGQRPAGEGKKAHEAPGGMGKGDTERK